LPKDPSESKKKRRESKGVIWGRGGKKVSMWERFSEKKSNAVLVWNLRNKTVWGGIRGGGGGGKKGKIWNLRKPTGKKGD